MDLSTALWLFTSLGFLINIPKSITAPICCLEFLGFVVDTETMTISLPTHKLHSIQREISCLLSLRKVPVRNLACLIVTLVATKPAVWTGPLHYRALQDLKIQSLQQHPSYQRSMSLSQEAQADLQWWLSDLSSHCSATMLKLEASIVIESDASKSGWDAVCQGVATGGRWQVDIGRSWMAHQFAGAPGSFSGSAVFSEGQYQCGSLDQVRQSHCHSLLEQDGQSHEIPACLLALEIWRWCLLCQISPHAEYLAGKDKVLACWESCHHDSSNWQLLPSVFEAVNHLLGAFTIDLFVSRTNAQLPAYCSWRPDPQARVVNALSTSWSQDQPYLFPPLNLIG